MDASILAASEALYVLSGRQFPGVCEGYLRPCGDACACSYYACGCDRLPAVFLRSDVLSVTEVDISGVVLDPDAYRLDGAYLLRVRSCTPGETCSLPTRVSNVTRQGVSFTILDPFDFLTNGRTGLYTVDLFLSTYNPNGLRRPSRAWSPDLPMTRTFPISNVS
jgi:hypothetical protein